MKKMVEMLLRILAGENGDEALLRRSKRVIKDCYVRHKVGEPGYENEWEVAAKRLKGIGRPRVLENHQSCIKNASR